MASSECLVTLFYLSLLCLGCLGVIISPPDITIPDRQYSKYIKNRATFTQECKAEGEPRPTYKWKKDGKDIVVQTGGDVQVNATTGTLTISDYGYYQHDGEYMCVASNRYGATAFSPIIKLQMIRLNVSSDDVKDLTGTEYSYFKMQCEHQVIGSDININWYLNLREDVRKLADYDNGRIYIDTEGTLHFTYLLRTDRSIWQYRQYTTYRCGVGSAIAGEINLGGFNKLEVLQVNNPSLQLPKLEYSNSGVQAKLFTKAILECVFSGFDPEATGSKAPTILWEGRTRNRIETGGKYEISEDTRTLTIMNVQESDEGDYYCKAVTSRGEETQWNPVELDVISDPIWLPSGAPADLTVPVGEDAVFNCNSRSMVGESPPVVPTWYENGVKTGRHTDSNKILISADKKRLTVRSPQKPKDIMCFQCKVSNDIGTTWGDACLNVILPITITTNLPEKQEIVRGDVIELLVQATSDPIAPNLNYEYTFKNTTYDFPYAYLGNKYFINTSQLTDEEYREVAGMYNVEIANTFQKKIVKTEVVLVDPLPPVETRTSSAGFPMWIIGLIAGIFFLIILLLIIICVICRKKQEGDYNVDKKEVGAGLNPKQELMEKGFDDYSRPNPDDYEFGDKPRRELPYDEDDPMMGQDTKSLGEYSEDEEALFFNEDGSFIGQYHKKDPTRPQNETQVSYT